MNYYRIITVRWESILVDCEVHVAVYISLLNETAVACHISFNDITSFKSDAYITVGAKTIMRVMKRHKCTTN